MHPSWKLLVVLLILNATAQARRNTAVPPDQLSAFAIPKTALPPTIDGRIDPDEWLTATAISGVANQKDNTLHPRPTTYYLSWDDDLRASYKHHADAKVCGTQWHNPYRARTKDDVHTALLLMGDRGLTPGSQVAHATNAHLLVATPWADAILDGEFHNLTDASTMDWVDGYPIEHMRTFANSHNFGSVISWMNKISCRDRDKRKAEQ